MITLVKEYTFENYNQRQWEEVSVVGLQARASGLKAGTKFRIIDGQWQCLPYKGYSIVSMLDSNPGNEKTSQALYDLQQQLAQKINFANQFYFLPKASFHQTIANTLSGNRFKEHIINTGLEEQYPALLSQAFQKLKAPTTTKPIVMDMIGLSIFGTAMGALGIFKEALDFDRIQSFRTCLYSNPEMNKIDIKRTRPFVGHVTLAYLDGEFSEEQKKQFVQACAELNESFQKAKHQFLISKTALRSYENLSCFTYLPNYPSYSFV